MKNLLAVFVFAASFISIAPLASHAYEVGIVDEYRLLTEYKDSKDAQERIAELRAKIQDLLIALNRDIESASKNKKITQQQLAEKQKAAEKQLLEEKAKAETVANSLRQEIEEKVRRAINAEAESQKLDLIITADTAYYGGRNITDDILRKLNAN